MRDVVVIGGGPAGLATAIFAAKEKLGVALFERRRFPVDKPCGEGIMPEGVRLLAEMGVEVPTCRRFEGIRYLDRRRVAEARFRGEHGLGIRRTVLSSALLERARALGVEVHEGTRARSVSATTTGVVTQLDGGSIESRWLVAADGLGSMLRSGASWGMRRYGYRRHFQIRPWSNLVEVHWGRGAEAYVTPVGDEEVGVAFLWHERAPSWEAMLARFPALEKRLEGAPPTSNLEGAGPLRRRMRRVASERLAVVGDASGYVDAITGDGVALAFGCARALAAAIASGDLGAYESAHRRRSLRYRFTTETILALAAHPRLRHRVVAALAERPRLFERLLEVSHPSPVNRTPRAGVIQ